jgi:hypothetical protein
MDTSRTRPKKLPRQELGLAAFPTLPQLAVYHELLARLGQEHGNRWIAMERSYE